MEIRVLSGGAPRAALTRLAPAFEAVTGHMLTLAFDGVSEVRRRLASGESTDVVLLPAPMIDAMAGVLRPDNRAALARSAIGVVVRRGATVRDLSSPEAVRVTLLGARSIAYSEAGATPGLKVALSGTASPGGSRSGT